MIRKAREDDLGSIIEIELISFKCPWQDVIFESILDHPGFVVYEEEGKVVGYALIAVVDNYGHLANIAVHPDHREKGIGSRILEWCINYARKEGANTMALEVRTKNHSAQRFYYDNGFRAIGIIPNYYIDEDAYFMEKKL